MAVGMVTDDMSLVCHPPDQLLAAGNIFSHDKEGRADAPALQAVEQPFCVNGMRTVVEGEGDAGTRRIIRPLRCQILHRRRSGHCTDPGSQNPQDRSCCFSAFLRFRLCLQWCF